MDKQIDDKKVVKGQYNEVGAPWLVDLPRQERCAEHA